MSKLLLVGEPLIRVSPNQFQPLTNACDAQLFFGGSEVNIARTLGGFGLEARLFTALPDNPVGHAFHQFLKQIGVDMTLTAWQGNRVGVYYLENGFGCRASQVYYDRCGSSFSALDKDSLDLAAIFEGISHFHFSGISLALGKKTQDLIEVLAREARKRQVCVSFDLNFRSSMIAVADAKRLFSHFAQYADIIFGMEPLLLDSDDFDMFDRNKADATMIRERLAGLYQRYQLQAIYHTERSNDAQGSNRFKAYAYDGQFYESCEVTTPVLQRVGSGDAFVAGLLYQLLEGNEKQRNLDFAVATASLKCTVAEDQLYHSVQQVEAVLANQRDVQR
ncbi:sugar kinase [Streptococcus pyogenes]|uniref:sugar kinase n=1 Tax=Streptococcus pyogenes TaxID=1314 RepID=UPI0010A1D5C2|nr:sugar kinase [Streptococcus pyogenes]VHB32434.1 2-dehydro-3-deoxygluconokinase [Streptococcus pyogenes]